VRFIVTLSLIGTLMLAATLTLQTAEPYDVTLSGNAQFTDTAHFRIHYTLTGIDAVTPDYVSAAAEALELAWTVQIERLGWAAPPSDAGRGGSDLYDVFLKDLTDEDALGVTSAEDIVRDNPNTPETESYAAASILYVENDFAGVDFADGQDAISLMRATVAHEFNHAVQFGYDYIDAHDWIYEASAVWMETQTVGVDQDATGYVSANYEYPEICFGSVMNDSDSELHYGEWLFVDHLAQEYGAEVVRAVWEQSRELEGFAALEAALEPYMDMTLPAVTAQPTEAAPMVPESTVIAPPTLPAISGGGNLGIRPPGAPTAGAPAVGGSGNLGARPNPSGRAAVPRVSARGTSPIIPAVLLDYRLRNLARDYDLAALFDATVWLEGTIDSLDWTNTGIGLQELSANYFAVTLPAGTYSVIVEGASALTLWSVEIVGGQMVAYDLSATGTLTVRPGTESYLMVFNPVYDEDLSDCTSVEYDLKITATEGAAPPTPYRRYDAGYFASLDEGWE